MRKEAVQAAKYFMLKTLAEDAAFCDVPARALQSLVDAAALETVPKGRTIYEAGECWTRLAFVVEGVIAMLATGVDGKEHLYEQAEAGGFFGVSSVFDGAPEMARTVVVSRSAAYAAIERETVLALCKEHGSLGIAFAATLAGRVRKTTSLLAAQVNLTAPQRIARYLLGFADGPGRTRARDPLPLMTQTQIGAAAGTVKDVAARTITEFERRGALEREHGHVCWLHRERLAEIGRVIDVESPA